MPDYQMVSEWYTGGPTFVSNLRFFNDKVNELLAKGYELYGPPSVIETKSDGETCILYNQALFKP